ncbi:MAG: AraC family transcriptional regulator [Verrucomicrobiales bacterium]
MGKLYQDILLEELDIRLPGLHVQRLALHQHIDRVEKVKPHSHSYQQILLYFRGRGVQRVSDKRIPIRRGTVINIRAREEHEFIKERDVSPVCLVIDFKCADFAKRYHSMQLSGDATNRIEQALYRLGRLHVRALDTPLAVGTEILGILTIMQIEGGNPGEMAAARVHPVTEEVSCVIRNGDLTMLSPAIIAKQIGKSVDHLNRQLKRESGVTIGQLLSAARLEEASDLLSQPNAVIGEVAAAIGYLDQNYFSRWFRQQTGQTPTEWRSS